MNNTTSVYLDFVRFISALLVFLFHAHYKKFDGAWLKFVGTYGHDAVIIFFVLSGFVIAYITNTKETTIYNYTKNRLARLYSVTLPALLLTLILDYFGKSIDQNIYTGKYYQDSDAIYRFFTNLFFINEIWFKSWRAFSNGPFWSLCFEFWYYVIYAGYFYFDGKRKLLFTGLAILISGPKILLLFPVWTMGVITFHLSKNLMLNKRQKILYSIIPLVIYILYRYFNMPKLLLQETINFLGRDFVYDYLSWSRRFLNDYFVGWLLSIHLLGIIALSKNFSFSVKLEKLIRYFSGMTFALYLFHYPFLLFYWSMTKDGVITVIMTFISVMALAPFTEGKKRQWQRLIDNIFSKCFQS